MRVRAIAMLVTILISTKLAMSQSTFGNMIGVVKDPGALVVAGAQVTLSGVDDRSSHNAITSGDGTFEFMNLKPGKYEVVVEAPGFADSKAPIVELVARQTVRLDIALKVRSASELIEVGDQAPMINTESATLADSKDFLQVSQLPVNYRGSTTSSLAMVATVPGTQQDANGNVSVGGGLPSQVQYSVDGASTVNIRQNGALANMNPSSELISEFKVSQFNNNAEFAQLGDITISTKSGGEHFHGSAFEYLQNSVFDATTFGFPSKPHKAFNTFGGSLGGPVKIPGLVKGTPHTFFFVDYEGNRRRLVTPLFLNVPTVAMRSGNLNGLASASGSGSESVYGSAISEQYAPSLRPAWLHQPCRPGIARELLHRAPQFDHCGFQLPSANRDSKQYERLRCSHRSHPYSEAIAVWALELEKHFKYHPKSAVAE
jgi:hypothetical protein